MQPWYGATDPVDYDPDPPYVEEEENYDDEEPTHEVAFGFSMPDRDNFHCQSVIGQQLFAACGIMVLYDFSGAITAAELVFIERQLREQSYGMMLASTYHGQKRVMAALTDAGWNVSAQFRNPNSGNDVTVWQKLIKA